MNVTVRKPDVSEKAAMEKWPTWSCGVSEFDWHYDSEEHCLVTEGEVTVEWKGGSVSFGPGDYVVFPVGMDCVWKVKKAVKKHYRFQ
jgi:uncharacterized cupin superfamily protein